MQAHAKSSNPLAQALPVNDPDSATSARTRLKRDAEPRRNSAGTVAGRDRSPALLAWYHFVQYVVATIFAALWGWRASGRGRFPESGGALLVSNHTSFLDVFILGIPLRRPLNYVARSTLFLPVLGFLIRSVGGFPIQREGMGASGMKETLRRLKHGGVVTLFPEGTRSPDGALGPLKPGIAVLVARAGVPVIPAGIAGAFESWPRTRLLPVPHPVRVHYGPPILPEDIEGMDAEAVTALIRARMAECLAVARAGLDSDLQR
jgi:1-acyl-sn-glycerol-3-phosphate acyltransferase